MGVATPHTRSMSGTATAVEQSGAGGSDPSDLSGGDEDAYKAQRDGGGDQDSLSRSVHSASLTAPSASPDDADGASEGPDSTASPLASPALSRGHSTAPKRTGVDARTSSTSADDFVDVTGPAGAAAPALSVGPAAVDVPGAATAVSKAEVTTVSTRALQAIKRGIGEGCMRHAF